MDTTSTSSSVARIFADGSRRNGLAGWGAVALADGRKPHVMGGKLKDCRNTTALEIAAMLAARRRAREWCHRHGLNLGLMVVHSDNQAAAETLSAHRSGRLAVFRWIAREHPMMRLAHRRARAVTKGA